MNQEKPDVGELIELIKTAFRSEASDQLGSLVTELSQIEPVRWVTLLYLNGVIPHPLNREFSRSIKVLFRAWGAILEGDSIDFQSLPSLIYPLQSLLTMYLCFSSIRRKLDELDVWSAGGAKLVYRVAAFLEDQERLAFEHDSQQEIANPHVNILSDKFPTMVGGPTTSRLAGYEEHCENLQLILAYAIQKYGGESWDSLSETPSPYEDADFSKLLVLASTWRIYEYLWEDIVYLGWIPKNDPQDGSGKLYVPSDYDELVRYRVAGIRRQEIVSENVAALHSIIEYPFELISQMSHSIAVAPMGKAWDGQIDLELLRKAYKTIVDDPFILHQLEQNHYASVIDDVNFGDKESKIAWSTYLACLKILSLICLAYSEAADEAPPTTKESMPFRRLIIINKILLSEIISSVSDLDIDQSRRAINTLTFNLGFRQMEIWDLPVIEINSDEVLLVPALVLSGNRVRACENAISEWGEGLFQKRGQDLEDSFLLFLRSRGIKAQKSIVFHASDKEEVECDLVVYWDGYLVFIEAKCTKEIFSPAQLFRGGKVMEEAADQLEFRQGAVLNNWDNFRLEASELDLPLAAPGAERIKLVAVTNVLEFTGLRVNNAIITDEYCFRRFFGEAEIKSLVYSDQEGWQESGTVGRIRRSDKATALEFFTYLNDPPQVRMISECLEKKVLRLMKIEQTDPSVGMLHLEYHPEQMSIFSASKKLLRKARKKRQFRHRRKK